MTRPFIARLHHGALALLCAVIPVPRPLAFVAGNDADPTKNGE